MEWAQLGKWLLLCWNCSHSWHTLLRFGSPVSASAFPVCNPYHEPCSVSASVPKTPWINEPRVREDTLEFSSCPIPKCYLSLTDPHNVPWGKSGCGKETTQGTASVWWLQASTKLWRRSNLHGDMRELCVHFFLIQLDWHFKGRNYASLSVMSSHSPRWTFGSHLIGKTSLNRQQIRVISFNKITENSRSIKSVESCVYSE